MPIPYQDEELIYAATAKCRCGEGLAYPVHPDPAKVEEWTWRCSAVLKGALGAEGEEPGDAHDMIRPFQFWKVRGEFEDSHEEHTTRQGGRIDRERLRRQP